MTLTYRNRPARVRCRECGSTRVRGIVLGYCDGPLIVADDGRVEVDVGAGEWVEHDAADVQGGSVVCANCGSGRVRVETARREAVLR